MSDKVWNWWLGTASLPEEQPEHGVIISFPSQREAKLTATSIFHMEVGPPKTPKLDVSKPFTRSNGTVMARLYERLTKASRRQPKGSSIHEKLYRQGVYDAYKALQEELSLC